MTEALSLFIIIMIDLFTLPVVVTFDPEMVIPHYGETAVTII